LKSYEEALAHEISVNEVITSQLKACKDREANLKMEIFDLNCSIDEYKMDAKEGKKSLRMDATVIERLKKDLDEVNHRNTNLVRDLNITADRQRLQESKIEQLSIEREALCAMLKDSRDIRNAMLKTTQHSNHRDDEQLQSHSINDELKYLDDSLSTDEDTLSDPDDVSAIVDAGGAQNSSHTTLSLGVQLPSTSSDHDIVEDLRDDSSTMDKTQEDMTSTYAKLLIRSDVAQCV
jgi:hypothetical protein